MKRVIGAVLCSVLLLPSGQIFAQQPTCEDTLRTVRILAEQYAASRSRTEIEAAQTVAALLKQIEVLKAEAAKRDGK